MGFAQNYLSLCASTRGTISQLGAYALEKVAGISPDMYRKQDNPPKPEKNTTETVTANDLSAFAKGLADLIEKAAYNGVRRALAK